MTLEQCYAALGGNYQEVVGRLRSEALVRRFVLKFLDDPSYDLLCRSMAQEDCAEAFRAVHTIKGVCQNLGFSLLYASSCRLCDALRNGFRPDAPALARQVDADYAQTIAAIRAYQAAQ